MPENTMSTFELIHRPALGAARPVQSDRIQLAPLPEGAVLQVIGPVDGATSVSDATRQAGLSLRPNGPGQWFLVSDVAMMPAAIAALRGTLGAAFTLVDQSHGRIRIAIEGPAVEDVLAKGTGVDLAAFPLAHAAATLIGHIPVHIGRISTTQFEIMALRGFAQSLWHDLKTMAAEYSDNHH